jgi:hypothetical protein
MARTLGAPVSVPAGKVALQHVHAGHAVAAAFDVADDVHDVAVALDGKGLGHLDAAGLGDAADVVARQVDQHHVLGALLGVGQQFGLGSLVGSGVAPRGRVPASGRMVTLCRPATCFLAHQDLGRRPDDVEVAQVVVVHVGRRVERAQRAVQAQRALGVALLDALADAPA